VLGGLISNNYNKINSGVPFLKDIPLVGSAFQNNTVSGDRTELLILITPYIVRGDEDMADFAERYASDMNAAFRTGRGWSYTLTPFSLGARVRGLGLDLPSAARASERPPLFPRRAPAPAAPVEPDPAPEAVIEPPVSAAPT
jgi:general secretion pathway protein D